MMPAGMREARSREFRQRERAILDAALALFNRDDWQTVTIEQIAESADIGKGTVYKHFAGKDEIYARLALEFQQAILRRLRGVQASLPVEARLRETIRILWDLHLDQTPYQRLVQFCEREDFRRGMPDAMRQEFHRMDTGLSQLLHQLLQEGIAQGLFPDKPPERLLFGAHSALLGSIRLVLGGCGGVELDPETCREEITEFILAGLKGAKRAERERD